MFLTHRTAEELIAVKDPDFRQVARIIADSNGVADIGRHFCDIDRRGSVQAEMHAVPFAGPADAGGARVVEAAQRIGGGVKLDVDPAHLMLCRPLKRLFEPEPAPDVNPDPITQTHQVCSAHCRQVELDLSDPAYRCWPMT